MTDHTEMQIPRDIIEAARRVVVDDLGMDLPGKLQSSYIDCIAEAIFAERERMNAQLKDCRKCGRKNSGW